jgi:dephospho-CoA kinase
MQLKRLIERNKLTKVDAKKRINSQMDINDKKMLADVVINNCDSIEKLHQQIDQFLEEINK